MTSLIIIRLHPTTPQSASDFTAALAGLTLTAYDLTVADGTVGVPLGSASGLADPHLSDPGNNGVDASSTPIMQHYVDVPIGPSLNRYAESAATAVIVADPPAGHPEFPTPGAFDLRLEITRSGQAITDTTIDYNVLVLDGSGPLPNDQTWYFGARATVFAAIPPLPPSGASAPVLALPANGAPPAFDDLRKAVDAVLALDPGGASLAGYATDPSQLTAAKCAQIAAQIVWNRAYDPPPAEPADYGSLYTSPEHPLAPDNADSTRQQFEGALTAYHATTDALATQLTPYVYAAWAAVLCEQASGTAAQARLSFPLPEGAGHTEVLLTQPTAGTPLDPAFLVPAAYFYALGMTLPTQSDPDQRYDLARFTPEAGTLRQLATAVAVNACAAAEGFVTQPALGTVNLDQTARRLSALGAVDGTLPTVLLAGPPVQLVTNWLAHTGPTATIDQDFWAAQLAPPTSGYLATIVEVLAAGDDTLQAAILGAPLNVTTTDQLLAVTDTAWRALFLPPGGAPRLDLLPDFTEPGTPAERVEAFLRYLHKFFTVPTDATGDPSPQLPGLPAVFGAPAGDVFSAFIAHYASEGGGSFAFGAAWDADAVTAAIADTLPGDPAAQAWLAQALDVIDALHQLTAPVPAELRFSVMEALYARGFTTAQAVRALLPSDFQNALTGTVAYPYAAAIQTAAGGSVASAPAGSTGFQPVNDGTLTDCTPPPHLSPLGPVAYLAEMLTVSAAATCEQPTGTDTAAQLGTLLAGRRGPLGDLLADPANLNVPLPAIDLVNESLAALAGGGPAGAVFDTTVPSTVDPAAFRAAVPENSTPAATGQSPAELAAWAALRTDFSAPLLPYDQPLDVQRGYLRRLCTTRFATMRRFRRDITEFVLDPAEADEPAGFARHQWRYPVRFELALEYLGITEAEYDGLYHEGAISVPALYGYPVAVAADGEAGPNWAEDVLAVPEFLRRTGLDYCELVALQRCSPVPFSCGQQRRESSPATDGAFPECEPCHLGELRIVLTGDQSVVEGELYRLIVFIRLWRRLSGAGCAELTVAELADICAVLGLFAGGQVNADFPRQLAAFLMLREDFRLPLSVPGPAASTPTGRIPLLALWAQPDAPELDRGIALLLDGVERHARSRFGHHRAEAEFRKIVAGDLDALSALGGFDPATPSDTWRAEPTHTLRFAEILAKVHASDFTVGDLLFLFTTGDHADGDDPFPLGDPEQTADDPLALPEIVTAGDHGPHSLWALRRALLDVEIDEPAAGHWTWPRITAALRDEFGYTTPSGGVADPLIELGRHFFPRAAGGEPARYRTALAAADTTALMWTAQSGPFGYDSAQQELTLALPLRDTDLIDRLRELRPLRPAEQAAVRELYFAPRAALAPFAALFADFDTAVDHLVQEADEDERFRHFQRRFALFHARCELIADHLARHVGAITEERRDDGDAEGRRAAARRILRGLLADGNLATAPWENDSGEPPAVTWEPGPSGGAFAALLGLAGTGVLGEYRTADGTLVWRETRGPLTAFGRTRDEHNAPVPTILPALDAAATAEQSRFVAVRNGFALRDHDGLPLGGVARFGVRWTGVLLVEHPGQYRFLAGAPAEGEPDCDSAAGNGWRVTLGRGQKTWTLLEHHPHGEESGRGEHVRLHRGAYRLTVEFDQDGPRFDRPEELHPAHTGFQLAYAGPDTGGELSEVDHSRLYRDLAETTLGDGITGLAADTSAARFLDGRYVGSLRDIRRTYQRAFKTLLLTELFRLSAHPVPSYRESELGYLLDHPQAFAGSAYPRTGPNTFGTHHAWFAPDLLPVADPFAPQPVPPHSPADQRAYPSRPRAAALFDGWERTFDYRALRAGTEAARERPAWLVFAEASEGQPDEPAQLLRHLGVDLRHADAVLTYFATPAEYAVSTADLTDERWAVRVWQGELWLRRVREHFTPVAMSDARPALWAGDDPGAATGTPPLSGNANLLAFVQDGCLAHGAPRRYEDIRRIDDGLRERGRAALLAYLCTLDRVPLPWAPGSFATIPGELSGLLLLDVETGLAVRRSRIEDAVHAVQAFVQRARLGLEPGFVTGPAFAQVWDERFASFHCWQAARRRELYRENWIAWDDLRSARRIEAFRFLEDQLRGSTLTLARPGGGAWWPGSVIPEHPTLELLQERTASRMGFLQPAVEGLGLQGIPEAAAALSWLAPVAGRPTPPSRTTPPNGGNPGNGNNPPNGNGDDPPREPHALPHSDPATDTTVQPAAKRRPRRKTVSADVLEPADTANPTPVDGDGTDGVAAGELPLWLEAAVGLGTRFVRLAAAGLPPAAARFAPHHDGDAPCCDSCGQPHPPLVDEYYFWLAASGIYSPDDAVQQADTGVPATGGSAPASAETSFWEDPAKVPGLLLWPARPLVHLHWSRVHNGEFQSVRRDTEGVLIDPVFLAGGGVPALAFMGRTGDSLRFEVSGGIAPTGYGDGNPPGFRYDLPVDEAVALPEVVVPAPVPAAYPGDLTAYPFFAYVEPGAPVEPLTPFSVATAVAGALRGHCRFEAALKWYELAYAPLAEDNTWGPDGDPRHRSILLEHLDTLLQWGDQLVCRNSPEQIERAGVLFGTAARVLGGRPVIVEHTETGYPMTVGGFEPLPAPLNPRLTALHDRVADRLALVRANLDGRRLALAEPRDDNGFWGDDPARDGWREEHAPCGDGCCGGETCEPDGGLCCGGPYRFEFTVRRAMELSGEVRELGARLLSAYEKGDAETLAALHTAHDKQLTELAVAARQSDWREADWQVQALGLAKQGAQARLRYFQQLLANGLDAGETGYVALTGASIASRAAGTVTEAIGQAMNVTPDIAVGVAGMGPLEATQLPIGSKLAKSFAAAARILYAVGDGTGTAAGLSLTQGGWDRRTAEWQLQVETIGIEIQQVQRQILAAERRRDGALRALNEQRQSVEHAAEVSAFLRDKFTSSELYLYLQRETAALHRRMYDLAEHTARQAERAYNYERGHTTRRFLPDPGWDDLHDGLLAGDRLQLALRRMESSYTDLHCREYELTKHLSLRLDFPAAFLRLRQTGHAEIEVPEWMFDLDYPGQYLRRIKNVTLTIPCVVGPYTGVHCRLTLLGSSTRIDPRLAGPRARCCGDAEPCHCDPAERGCDRCGTGECGCPEDGGADYAPLPADPRIVQAYAATEAIATSAGQNDAGLFELSFRDERYLPFEFAGAVSRWRIELPPENNRFDFDTLTDVVLHLNYTAREGGAALRRAAGAQARSHLPGSGLRLFDVRHDLPEAWARLRGGGDRPATLPVRLGRAHFPYLPHPCDPRIVETALFVELADACCQDDLRTRFVLHHTEPHGRDEPCGCAGHDVDCVADPHFGHLFHGVLDHPLTPLTEHTEQDLGEFHLAVPGHRIRAAYLLCRYDTP